MLQLDNQLVILFIFIISIILCYKSSSTFLCFVLGGILLAILYKNNQTNKSKYIPNFPLLLKRVDTTKNYDSKLQNIYYMDDNNIKVLSDHDVNNELETAMEIELNSAKIKNNNKNIQINSNEIYFNPVEDKESSKEESSKENFITREDIPNICLGDNVLDGDERIAYNSIHRNEPTRVIVGMRKAYQNLNKYVLEEVQEIEGKEWWGNNDY